MTREGLFASVIAFGCLSGFAAGGADTEADDQPPDSSAHHEIPADGPAVRPDLPRSLFKRLELSPRNTLYAPVQVNVNAAGENIPGDAGNETSIAVDPTRPNRIAIGWRQFDTIYSNFRQAGWAYSRDGGRTWTFTGVIEPGVFRSDPVLDYDAEGNFYYNSLTSDIYGNFSCDVFISDNGGETWDDGVYAYGGDKQWMAIDRTGGIGHGNIYANWNRAFSSCDGDTTRSYDQGESFLDCISAPNQPFWGTTTVGPDGAVYVAGNGFILGRSDSLQDPYAEASFEFIRFVDLGAPLRNGQGPNPGGLLGQGWVVADHSGGPYHGNLYMLASVGPFAAGVPSGCSVAELQAWSLR